MKRTLFIHPNNDFTGSTKVLADIIEKKYPYDTIRIITKDSKGFLSNIPNVKITPIYYPTYKGKEIPVITGIIWKLHASWLVLYYALFYQILYINTILPYYAAIIGRLYRKQIVYHIHEYFIIKNRATKIAEYVFNHIQAERIFVSKYLKEQYPSKESCKSYVKYNFLSESFLKNIKIKPLKEREGKRIIMISSLNKIKGIFMFIAVARKMPEYQFDLILSQDIQTINSFIKEEIPLEEIPQNIKLIPSQKNIHPFLANSDLLLNLTNPSLAIETFGMTILEAMAYGIPAIVPNVGGPVELIKNGFNGYTIDVSNINIIISTIKNALKAETYNVLVYNSLIQYQNISNL